jgi:hypothetical protein
MRRVPRSIYEGARDIARNIAKTIGPPKPISCAHHVPKNKL